MKLHNFDISGVTIYPLTSSSQPTVVLKGSPGKVSEVSNRLGPFLQTLVQDRVTIALPGAVRYFESASGRDAIISVADSQKCLIQLQEQPHATRQILASGAGLSEVNTTVASYSLRDGFQVLVCQGDITKQEADVLVNAANEDLEHIGGVAAALSKAGGPEVQKECRALVKKWGKVPTGRVVSTTGGNLNCKSLLHAVGPVGGKSVKLQMVRGDIINESVDAIINTTDFSKKSLSGMISNLGIPPDCMCTTGPGLLACREIIHASFKCDTQVIRKKSKKILKQCESKGYSSVAFPAINTGLYCVNLPAQWEPMHGDVFKKVTLNQNSAEYQAVAGDFVRTAQRNIQKIERLQNYHLWNAYSVCKQRISKKNDPADLGEMSLYHGTSAESSHCIERSGFNRSYAGDRVLYGKGVYFAVNAEYSASRYCPADASGLRRLYVARVLTGRYTLGEPSMKKTPARGGDPTDCFDSLVDNQQQPTMFVIFHDDQAYPEYLITFT
uniref:Poly [ADP-ribose] polymerase n=1 Tax=Gasterosteus aculeatus aculeatus TaxID=481459 RepID=A0AAQ4RAK1_GASAC